MKEKEIVNMNLLKINNSKKISHYVIILDKKIRFLGKLTLYGGSSRVSSMQLSFLASPILPLKMPYLPKVIINFYRFIIAFLYFYIFFYFTNIDGHDTDLWVFSLTIYTIIIFVVDMKLAVYTKYWTNI
jgi:hypothetical protein